MEHKEDSHKMQRAELRASTVAAEKFPAGLAGLAVAEPFPPGLADHVSRQYCQ